jgi:hypothetical protein
VALLSAIPGFGTFAYLAAKPVRSNRLLLRATGDAALKKVPFKLYRRSGLPRLIARPAAVALDPTGTGPARAATPTPRQLQAPRPIRVTTARPLPATRRGGPGRLAETTAAAGVVR